MDSLYNPDLTCIIVSHLTPHNTKKSEYLLRTFLVDAGRMLLFMWRSTPANGEVGSKHNANTQCTVWGERRPMGREDILHFSYFAIKYDFFHTYNSKISATDNTQIPT